MLGETDGTEEKVGLVDSVAESDAAETEVMLTSALSFSSTQQPSCSPWSVGQQKMKSCAQLGCAEQRRGSPMVSSKSRCKPAPRIVPEAATVAAAHGSKNAETFKA